MADDDDDEDVDEQQQPDVAGQPAVADDWAAFRAPQAPTATDDWAAFRTSQTAQPADDWAAFRTGAQQQQQQPKAESPFWTTLRHVAHGLLPSAAGLAAIPGGIAAGAAIGLPEAGIGAIPGAFIGGSLAYMGARAAQDTGAKLLGFGDDLQMAADDAANPKSAVVGDILSAAPFLGPGAAPAAVRAGGALFGAGMEAFNQWKSGEDFDPARLAIAGAGGAFLTTPTRAGEALGTRAAAAIGRPELWHGTPGSDAAAGTAKEQPPPAGGTPGEGGAAAATPETTAPVGDRTGPEDLGKEAPPPAERQGVNVGETDPAQDAAIRAKMEPGGEAAAPATSAKLEAQFPRVPDAEEQARPLQPEEPQPTAPAEPTPTAATIDRALANRMLNQPRVLNTEAAKRGMTPEALKAQAQDVLKSPMAAPEPPPAPVATQEPAPPAQPPSASVKIGRGPRAKDEQLYSLLEYLAHNGGLQKDIPELKDIFGGKNRLIPGFGNLLRKDGMSLDQAWLKATREGRYLNDASDFEGRVAKTTTSDLLDLIDKEARGTRQYRVGSEGTTTAGERGRAAELNRVAIQRAVDGFSHDAGLGALDPKLYDRTVEIMEKEGVSSPDMALERAIMEHANQYEKDTQDQHVTVGHIEGWDVDDAAAARGDGRGVREAGAGPEPAGPPAPPDAGEVPRGAFEMGAEGKPQGVIPGTERIGEGELAQRRADERLRPTAPQRPADEGLFSDTHLQENLFTGGRDELMRQRLDAAEAAPSPAAHLRETAAMYREQGQEGRARQFEQAADAFERSQQQQQQQQQRQQPPRQPPGGRPPGTPPEPPRVPKEQLIEQGKLGDEKAFNLANKADDELNKLSTIPAADMLRYKGLGEEASKMHPEVKGKGGETIYNAIVNGTYDKLPANLRAGFEHATGDISKENAALRKELVDRGLIDNEADDPRYMKRVMKSAPVRVDDPITEGHIGRLPGMHDPSSTKELAFYGAQDKDGNRLVLAGKGDRIAVMKNREPEGFITNPKETSPQTGDKLTYNGKEYTVDRGRENEIEQHAVHEGGTPVEYHKNAFVSKFVENRELRMMKDYNDWLDRFKDPEKSPFKSLMTRDADTAKKRGWPQSDVPDLKGLYMHPDLEQVLHNNYKPGMGLPDINWLRVANQLGIRSIFWNPVPHAMNAFMHYLVGRGTDWIDPRKYGTLAKSVIEGFKSAYTQDQLLQDINRAGGSLIQSKIDSQNIVRNLGKAFDADLRNNPGKWEQYARTYGLGHGIDAVKLWYEHAGKALWTFSDALMASRIRELEMNGMSREDAIASARVHMPDYRLPIKIFGRRQMVRFMSDPNVSVFGRYHMGMLNSLSTMMTHTLGPNATMAERKEALGNVFALAALAFVVKPALDKAVQSITGNKDAEVKPRGPLAPLTGAYGVATGKKDLGMVLSNVFTLSPAINAIRAGLSNRDFAGRRIVDPGSPWYDKFGQAAEFATGTLVSPYSTFGPTIQPGSARGSTLHEFLSQITDTKVPTQKEVAGQRYGQKLSLKEAKTRAQHPRGLIEYGLGQLTR